MEARGKRKTHPEQVQLIWPCINEAVCTRAYTMELRATCHVTCELGYVQISTFVFNRTVDAVRRTERTDSVTRARNRTILAGKPRVESIDDDKKCRREN